MWRTSLACILLAASLRAAQPTREQVEADWAKQDDCRLAEILRPDLLPFLAAKPGQADLPRLAVPRCSAPPKLDGDLSDPCWASAAHVPGAERFLLCHDGQRLFLAASVPASAPASDPTAEDAAGAVDGVKDGKYAFHTGQEPNPWWQVDLGSPVAVARIVVWNRLDYQPGLHNADNLLVLTSDDGQKWTLRHDNKGNHFGGLGSKEPPLEVKLEGVRARFIRLQIRSDAPIYFHLDEVEVYGPDDAAKNLALKRPASQSSLSQWSRGAKQAGFAGLCAVGKHRVTLAGDAVALNGAPVPAGQGSVARRDGAASVELAVPLSEAGGTFAHAGGQVALVVGGDWQLVWHELPHLGFGRNRVHIEIRSAAPLTPPVEVTAEVLVLERDQLQRRTFLSRKLDGPWAGPVEFEVASEGPAAIVLTASQAGIRLHEGKAFFVHPVKEVLARTQRLLADSGAAAPSGLAEVHTRAEALAAQEREKGCDPAARLALYREARWLAREAAMRSALDFDKLLFIKRFTQESYPDVCLNHMPWVSRPGGDICVLDLKTGEVRNLLNGRLGPGHVHGMDLWYGGDRVVFGYAKARSDQPPPGWLNRATSFDLRRSEEPTHIFEIGIDGTGLRQLTQGEWSDLDPCYLPSGDIVFVSERCGYSLQCNELDKDETSCNLYVMRPDGSGIRRLTVTKDGDYLPHVLADGTIGYTRWEYHERGWAHIQSLWYVRPDGTGADALFKQHFNEPWAVEECRSVPGSHKLVGIATGHHTLPAGPVILIEPQAGMNDPNGIHIVTPGVRPPEGGMSGNPVPGGGVRGVGGLYMTPWPLSEAHFLASYTYGKETDATGYALYLIGVDGTKELVYRDPAISCSIPIPLRPRQKPPILPDNTDPAKPYAVCAVNDVALGVDGVDPTAIRYIRIAEPLGWPYCNTYGGQRYEPDVKGVMINWNPVRILGTVPVESDGSAFFQVPVDTAVYFQLLDENHMELRRMRSFISFQSGEQRSCTGCHHTWEKAPPPTPTPLAMRRDPVVPTPPPWGADKPISFLRDVQPVFDRHCVACHAGLKPAGGLDFSGGLTPRHNRAYDTILAAKLISRSNVGDDAKVTPPLAFGSHKSHLIAVLRRAPHTERVKLPQDDWLRLVTWIDANGPYHDGFINKRQPEPPYDLAADRTLADQIATVHAKRCGACHAPAQVSRLDWVALRQPAASLFLTAPLAREAGGTAKCKDAVYRDTSDPDYKAVRELVEAAARRAWALPRRDLRALQAQEAHAARPAP
ncbi:MAG TPA: discoidin domain-containing protein [Planctomycetota bacterium]|nr:discoidin domain-containing protein [Planctomycetota bacterium]HRR80501.1 discoidin domain-containing protein [Planctomycetota bacterium]HRT94907.1 discoidin domain-containing protein [Planctomycetota bacterium]